MIDFTVSVILTLKIWIIGAAVYYDAESIPDRLRREGRTLRPLLMVAIDHAVVIIYLSTFVIRLFLRKAKVLSYCFRDVSREFLSNLLSVTPPNTAIRGTVGRIQIPVGLNAMIMVTQKQPP